MSRSAWIFGVTMYEFLDRGYWSPIMTLMVLWASNNDIPVRKAPAKVTPIVWPHFPEVKPC